MFRGVNFIYLTLLLMCSCQAFTLDKFKLSPTSGAAPLNVTIVGPSLLTKLSTNQYSKWVGCGFNIDWGDPSQEPLPKGYDHSVCSWHLQHIYAKAGTYTVKASTFHPNPDDSQTVDWSSEETVTVTVE